jgi:hypothetical protein
MGARIGDLPGETHLFLVTDGAPNCNTAPCGAASCVANIEEWAYAEDEQCDDDINCCGSELFGPTACLDQDATERAVEELREAGIQTFVVGIPGTEVYGDVLDRLARAGGTARGAETDYYRVDDAAELARTLTTLGEDVTRRCEVELFEAPPDRELVNVFFDETLIVKDPEDGWTWGADDRIDLVGAACELVEAGQVLQVQVAVGCPAVVR